ncbi:hypothetical protein CD149_04095 [Staphylococcus condimenti]|uniref:Uncharacterized protein n=1 Tax=Staphylococcus condimenti TaxID=70255 RepID=A0A143PEA8_9STAP|nr:MULTISPECIES: hypothetical protein [Staphylococcus]AMY06408.1 hypothetical protein A4G25_10900 [Staphylococcus condimenti]APR60290.1 hypothetical protein BTZ13_03315 [Staphylococcus condimenti]OFP00252.1 hypothetical protein HMPREF3007_11745 [Staphylococcus sp. HMSC065E08]PNZ61943.1 hypothetical protein CD149_04095 [Staphylococcus condimenti]QQS81785.1 hypothetical protein I6J05_07575 [Staphylococcus condimenti]
MKNNYAITINPVQQCMNTIKQSYKAQLEDFDFEHSYNHVEHLSQWERPALRNFNTKVEIVEQYFNIKNYNPHHGYYLTINSKQNTTVLVELNHDIRMEISNAQTTYVYDITSYVNSKDNYLYLGCLLNRTQAQFPDCNLIEFKNQKLNAYHQAEERPLNYSI